MQNNQLFNYGSYVSCHFLLNYDLSSLTNFSDGEVLTIKGNGSFSSICSKSVLVYSGGVTGSLKVAGSLGMNASGASKKFAMLSKAKNILE